MTAQNFMNQDLSNQNFDGQDLSGSLFRGADLTNASFVGCKLNYANLLDTTIEGTDFTSAEMFHCNPTGAAGIATWTDAKVSGVPAVISMPGADTTTPPPVKVGFCDPLFAAVVEQTPGMNWEDWETQDRNTVQYYQTGVENPELVDLTGDYPITDHGRELYNTLEDPWGAGVTVEMQILLNECMLQNISFNEETQLFYK